MESSLSFEIPAIKGYHQIRLIGSPGGMSQMYRGTHARTGQEVIIKFMPAPQDAQEALKLQHRFDQEILIARLAANNHLLAAIDHGDIPMPGSDAPRLYLVYPFIEDGSLADLLTVERLWETWELPHITDVIAQAAEGLFHLHKSGIVHQDVKPNNFLWMPTNVVRNPLRRIHVWLIDFGTAEPERSGKSRDIKGTLKYLAPEQLRGEIKYSVDQYALALLARLLLTGHEPPLPNESDTLLRTRPTQLNPQRLFEPAIDHVLLKALAPQPEDRFPSVMEFAQALQNAVLKQIQLHLHTPHAGSLAPSQPQPAASSLHPAFPTRQAAPTPSFVPAAPGASIVLPPLTPPRPYEPPRPRGITQPRSAARNKASGPPLPAVPSQKWLTIKLPDTLRMLTWSPNGTELACTFYHDLPQIFSVKHSIETLPGFAHAHAACWSPDGRFLAMSMDNERHPQAEIRFCDRTAPRERQRVLSFDQPEPVRGLDWSRRGLLAVWLNQKLLVYDLSNIASQKRLPAPAYTLPLEDDLHCDQLTTLRWSPNGEWLAAGSNNGQIICWQPHTTQCIQQQPLKKNIRSISWSPDGRVLVVAFANKQVLFWSLQTGHITQAELPEHPRMVSISHQTGHIAIATEEMLFFFQHMGASTPAARHPGQLFAAFSADNKLATLDQDDGTELVIWQL
ncbi:MAG TPA: serine/threonine-protein kinase [Ktedonobacterales bacterium]|nr:serine/threonine-protein kinase [Ktedonobacterales bacterium]